MARPAPQVVVVTRTRIACDGDQAQALGHPRVWLTIPEAVGFVDCGYCDCRYELDPNAHIHDDH
ncbi:zinc-finger domain-containing protein [Paracoccus pacificus]|uniref:Zinc-finger domain-containing protein n=1 Tax=Paracoccus pacificus TaxID=1463598 RepID=A0ABW4R7U1_9RHOB